MTMPACSGGYSYERAILFAESAALTNETDDGYKAKNHAIVTRLSA
jgi:hypothetical protein